jgi:hypothetical protein
LPATLIASQAHAIIIPDPNMAAQARETMRSQLLATGFVGVTILKAAVQSADVAASSDRIAAA